MTTEHVNGSEPERPPAEQMPLRSKEAIAAINATQLFINVEKERDELRRQLDALKAATQLEADEAFEKHRAEVAALKTQIGVLEAQVEIFEGEWNVFGARIAELQHARDMARDSEAKWRGLIATFEAAMTAFKADQAPRAFTVEEAARIAASVGTTRMVEPAKVIEAPAEAVDSDGK